jgi:hypothetical protein
VQMLQFVDELPCVTHKFLTCLPQQIARRTTAF